MKLKMRILCGALSVFLLAANMTSAQKAGVRTDADEVHEEEVVAYVNFGTEVESYGMTATMGEKQTVTVSNKIGREGWVLDPKNMQNSVYIYFDVDDSIAKDIKDGSSYRVEVDYFDESISSLVMSYDSVSYTKKENFIYTNDRGGPAKTVPKEIEFFEFQDTNTWKTYSWFLENPAMNNRMSNGADFRIGAYGAVMGYSRGTEAPVVGAVRLIKTNTKSLLSITAETGRTGNIFFEGEKIKFTTHFDNSIYFYESETIGSYDADITYTIIDSNANVCDVIHDTVKIERTDITNKDISFDVDKYDTYTLLIEAECKRHKIYSREKTVFSYSKNAGKTQNKRAGIGTAAVVYDNPDGKGISHLIKAAGFGNVRVHNSYFGEIHGSVKDGYKVTNYSWYRQTAADVMKEFRKDGLDLLSFSAYYGNDKLKMGPNDELGSPFTDIGRENYTRFTRALMDMYGDSCGAYEIWNEWNGRKNYSAEARDIHKDYADLCKYMYPRLKEKNPDVAVFGMVPSNVTTGKEGYEWFEGALKAGAAKYLDGISIHIYQWYGSPITYHKYEELTNAYELLKKYGYEDKPLWITETGYSSNYENVNSEEMQAWYNVQSYIMFQEGDLAERVYLYTAADSLSNRMRTEREGNFGMLEGGERAATPVDDGEVINSAKPAFLGYANMNSLMYDAEFVKSFDFGGQTKGYQFKRAEKGKDMLALFSCLPNDRVTFDLGTDKVKVTDFYGNEREIASQNNKFTFNVNDSVIYVEGDFGRCIPADGVQAGPQDVLISSEYGEEHSVKLINNTGKALKARVKLFDNSSVECDGEFEVAPGGTEFRVTTGSTAPKKYEPLHITMYDGDEVYFDGDIILNMVAKVLLSAESRMNNDGKWYIRTLISNKSESKETGRIAFVKPESLASDVREICIMPNSTATVEFLLDDKYVSDDLDAQLKYVPSRENANPIYLEKVFNFEYMPRTDRDIVIDGDLSEWTNGWIHMDKAENFNQFVGYYTPYFGVNDLSGNVAFKYDDEYLYFAAEVKDNIFYAENVEPLNIWSVDSIQLALALYPENLSLKGDFEEFAMCLLDGKPVLYRHRTKMDTATPTVIDNAELSITQKDGITYYEFKAPWKNLIPNFEGVIPGNDILISVVINDNDGEGRKGVMQYGTGIDGTKDYTLFKRVYIGD